MKHRLTARQVETAPAGKYCDGDGLWLMKRTKGAGGWEFRFRLHGRDRTMSLGGWPGTPLASARKAHSHWRELQKSGVDPIAQRDREKRGSDDTSFETIARNCFASRQTELKDDGKAGRWLSPLEHHVFPHIGRTPVQDITQRDLVQVLAPIWHTKADTARKAISRINLTLKYAAAMDVDVDLQAGEKAKALLGKTRHQPKGHAFVPWREAPALYRQLGEYPSDLALRLNLLLGGGVRSAPIRFLRSEQIEDDVWTVPGDAMKGLKGRTPDFRVPLSSEAMRVVEAARQHERGGYLFPGITAEVINANAQTNRLKEIVSNATVHGFRKTFRSWAADTGQPYDVAETAIAHAVGNVVERTYQKSDLLDQRRLLMEKWAEFLLGLVPADHASLA